MAEVTTSFIKYSTAKHVGGLQASNSFIVSNKGWILNQIKYMYVYNLILITSW